MHPAFASEAKQKLFEILQRRGTALSAPDVELTRRRHDSAAPLSLMQEELWRFEASTPDAPPAYNESITVRRFGSLDTDVLERSLAEVIRRHEIWRTSYQVVDGQPVQAVHPAPERFPLMHHDLRRLSRPATEEQFLRLAREQAQIRFNFESGPLLRASLVSLSDTEHRVIIIAHQSIVDGLSVYKLLPLELSQIYDAFARKLQPRLPEVPIQFGDFARWQRESISGEQREQCIEFWRRQLQGDVPVLRWPDRARPARQTFQGRIRSFTLPCESTRAAHKVARDQGSTLFIVLLATFLELLHQYTGQEDITVGTLSPSGRKRSEVQRLLGYFLNPVPLRIDLSGHPSFADLVRRAHAVTSAAISNDDLPFEEIVRTLQPPPDPSRNPFFTVAVSLQPDMPDFGGNWSVTSMDAASGGARLDLYLAFIDRPEGLHGRAQYNPDLFEDAMIGDFIDDYRALLDAVTARPSSRLSELNYRGPVGQLQ